jgi:hypothetical protein
VRRNLALLAGVATGALGAILLRRRRAGVAAPFPGARDARAEELRRKLTEARDAAADEEEFQTAGMGESVAADQPPARPTREEADSLRRRVHERGRDTAADMRGTSETE